MPIEFEDESDEDYAIIDRGPHYGDEDEDI